MEDIIKKASVLVEAIPYIDAFRHKVFVIKYGGSILDNDTIRRHVLEDIIFLSFVGIRTILVHGGGPHITTRMKEMGMKNEFHDGIRVTDKETLKIVKEELETLNKEIVTELTELKGDATGLKGDANIIHVTKKKAAKDLGYVGTITTIEKKALETHLQKGFITVISPMGLSVEKQSHNINADEVASAIAITLKAEKLVILTNVPGVLREDNDPDSLISSLTIKETNELIKNKVIQAGMIPKVHAGLAAVNGGVPKAHIVDARLPHALLLEFFTNKGVGTQIFKEQK